MQTSTSARCTDLTGQSLCANGVANQQVSLKTVLAPDVTNIIKNNSLSNPNTVNGSLQINTIQQFANFLTFIGTNGRVNGNLTINVPANLSNLTLSVAGQATFKQVLTLTNSKLLAAISSTDGLNLSGKNLVVTKNDIKLSGQNSSGDIISQLIAGHNIEITKSNKGNLSAVLWAGEDIEVDGQLSILGGALAGHDVEINGDLSVSVTNPPDRVAEALAGAENLATFYSNKTSQEIAAFLIEFGMSYSGPSLSSALSDTIDWYSKHHRLRQ